MSMKIRPKDEMYIFIYDKDQIYIPSLSRIYGSDFRKISNVSINYSLTHMRSMLIISYFSDTKDGGQIWSLPIL